MPYKHSDYRRGLLNLCAHIDQLIAEADDLMTNCTLRLSDLSLGIDCINEFKEVRAQIEEKLQRLDEIDGGSP